MPKQLVIFDFDGVIVDSWDANLATSRHFNPDLSEERYRGWFEGNINGRLDEEPDLLIRESRRKAQEEFFARYAPLLYASPLFEGMASVIRDFADRYTLVIISSTISESIGEYLLRHNLRECFDEILGNDVDPSKEKKILQAMALHGVKAGQSIIITDTLGDIREAHRAGVSSVAVTWGFHERERLLVGEPYAIVETSADLPRTVNEYFAH